MNKKEIMKVKELLTDYSEKTEDGRLDVYIGQYSFDEWFPKLDKEMQGFIYGMLWIVESRFPIEAANLSVDGSIFPFEMGTILETMISEIEQIGFNALRTLLKSNVVETFAAMVDELPLE